MKTATKIIGFALALLLINSFPVLARGLSSGSNRLGTQLTLQNLTPLGTEVEETLLLMREEEKMARDVYQTLYKTWEQTVFKNIAASEQRHMDALLKKIDMFDLADPALPEVGLFNNPELQALYDKLIAQGNGLKSMRCLLGRRLKIWTSEI